DAETTDILNVERNLRQLTDPKRNVWITKPEYRRHRYKKESEFVNHCDVYVIPDRTIVPFLKEKMDIKPWMYKSKREICNSPYIYGTDISIEALARYKYEMNQTHAVAPITIGSLDIESSLRHPDKRTNAITVVCDKKIYTAALDEFMWKYEGKKKVKATVDDMMDLLMAESGKEIEKYGMTVIARIFQTEKELYDFIFSAIQMDEPDYMFIWNLGYDVPTIIRRMNELGLDPKDYFCSRTIPKNNRFLRYYEDRKKVAHIVQKWNWLHCTSMTQWLDAMALYGQINKTKPKESSYSLDAIMGKILGIGKTDFGGHSHQYMQEYEFPKYWAYNVRDALLVQWGSWKTQNSNSLYQLTEHSTLMDFSKQTVMLCNEYHHVLLAEGRVLASTGKTMTGPYDHLLNKVGGAVLDAKNVDDIGIRCVIERPNDMTNVLLYMADDDYEALYPNWKVACAIGKENKKATLVHIDGMNSSMVEPLMSALSDPRENAVWIASTYFGLPTYEEMEDNIRRSLKIDEMLAKREELPNEVPF
ncbi:MAG: hypothetical protein K2H85_09015, partial [Allobaculum sp.]|nr:hypothetical protein [Allobaculum sp.]